MPQYQTNGTSMISDELRRVILTTLQLDEWKIGEETLPAQIPGWDSLMHLNVISAVERHFSVRFTTGEIVRLKNVGELQRLVNVKKQEKRIP